MRSRAGEGARAGVSRVRGATEVRHGAERTGPWLDLRPRGVDVENMQVVGGRDT